MPKYLTRRTLLGTVAGAAVTPAYAASGARVRVSAGCILTCGAVTAPCFVGHGGIRRDKREGDGATPPGIYPLRRLFYRPDRMGAPRTGLPVTAMTRSDGWCDDPANPAYNQLVRLPYSGHHEELWLSSSFYDIMVVIGYNDAPVVPGRGSAIFFHLAEADTTSTDGCVAVPLPVLLAVVAQCGPGSVIDIANP